MNTKPWYYYGPNFLRAFFPWSVLWLLGCFSVVGRLRALNQRLGIDLGRIRQQVLIVWPYWWVAVLLLFFSCVSGKRTSYLLPLLPGLAIAVGAQLENWWSLRPSQRVADLVKYGRSCLPVVSAVALIIWLGLEVLLFNPYIGNRHVGEELNALRASLLSVRSCYAVILGLIVMLFYGAWQCARRRAVIEAGLLLQFGCFIIFAGLIFIPLMVRNELKGFEQWSVQVNNLVSSDSPLALIREKREEYFDPLLMYLQRSVELVEPVNAESLKPTSYVLVRSSDLNKWNEQGRKQLLKLNEPVDVARNVVENQIELWSPRG
jgi:hypothetical protein